MWKHLIVSFFSLTGAALAIETQALQVFMKDFNTGEVLFEKNADQQMVPSSMSKIMTAHLVFERLKSGDIKLNDKLHVSKEAWQKGGSRMFIQVDTQVPVEDLLQGVIVQSGNDACIVLAEGLAGTEATFAEEMTRKANEMGAKNSNFLNATGWPDEGHLTTARDLAIIAEHTIREFPTEYAKYYGMKEYTYNNIKQGNRNTLLYKDMGADGMKTGHTDAGGYGIVATAKQGDRRILLVVNGLPKSKDRDQEATALLNWGFNFFKNHKVYGKGDVVEVADVWSGAEKKVTLVSNQDIIFTIPRSKQKDVQVKIAYESPISAPLKAGNQVGTIEVTIPDKGLKTFPLVVAQDVPQAGFFQRISNSIYYLLWGKHSS
jgi:D-alanyl-D-alanine carboxypeptidase (penicillin-binding protein 5/6)